MPLRIRRGTDAERLSFIPLEGELIYTTDTRNMFVGDGVTTGGLNVNNLSAGFGGALGQDIDLNGFNIIGLGDVNTNGNQTLTGDLSVGGNITAQGNIVANGNIVLGNGGSDTITLGGIIESDIVPAFSNLQLGTVDRPWGTLHVNGVEAGGDINGNLRGNVYGNDSSLIIDASTNTISGNIVGSTFDGTFKGSFFGDDSTQIIDGINGKITANSITVPEIISGGAALNIETTGTLNINCTNSAAPLVFTSVTDGTIGSGNTTFWDFKGVKNSIVSPTPLLPGETIGAIRLTGQTSVSYPYERPAMMLFGGFDASADMADDGPASYAILATGKNNGEFAQYNFNHQGTFSTEQIKVSMLDATAKSAVTPEVGMIIYDSVAKKFQGYAEDIGGPGVPGWINLH